jgi:hypothetical protein
MQGRRSGAAIGLVAVLLAAGALSACGSDPVSYSDKEIIDRLNLEEIDGGDAYAIDGDPFCEVEKKLLNDAEEVEQARAGRNGALVIASREGNAGVKARPGFAPDCQADAKRKLNKLDSPAED